MTSYKQQINDYIEAHTDEMTAFLAELISYPSVQGEPEENAPFGKACRQVLTHFINKCESFGFSTVDFDGYAAHADMNDTEPSLGILCHLDVVPEGTGWSSDPYKAEIRDSKLFGRGAIDDKGPAAAALFAMHCVKELGIPLKKGVRIITGCNEENGSEDMEYYEKKASFPEMLVTPDGNYPVINIEKGMLRCEVTSDTVPEKLVYLHGGSVINAVPEVCTAAVKGVSAEQLLSAAHNIPDVKFTAEADGDTVKITAKGLCAHASTPEQGHNAVTAMLRLLSESGISTGLEKNFPYGETDGSQAGIKCSDKESGALTAVLSVLDIENGKLCGKIDSRFPVSKTLSEISEKLCAALSENGLDGKIILGSEPHYVDSDSSFVRTLLNVYEDITGEKGKCLAIGGGTYVHDTEGGVAFGAEFPGEDNHMHGADEFIKLESLKLNAKIYANMICALCGE